MPRRCVPQSRATTSSGSTCSTPARWPPHRSPMSRGHALVSARRSNLGDLAQLSRERFRRAASTPTVSRASTTRFSDATRGSLEMLVSSDHDRRAADRRANRARARSIATSTRGRRWITIGATAHRARVIASFTDLEQRAARARSTSLASRTARVQRRAAVPCRRIAHGEQPRHRHARASLRRRSAAAVGRLRLLRAKCTCCRACRFPGRRDSHTARTTAPSPQGYETRRYWDMRARTRRALGRPGRLAHRYADLRRLRRRRAMESAHQRALYAVAADASCARAWGRFYPVPGHQRAAGGGRRRHVLSGAARGSL